MRISAFVLFAFFTSTLTAACAPKTPPAPPPPSERSVLLGEPMPPFQTETMSGKPVSTAALEYQAAVLTFVTTDCEACERALLAAQAAFDENEEVRVIGIFQREGSEKARALAAKLKLGYPLTVDLDGTISRQYRVTKVPRTFVVDAHGLVRWIGGTEMNEAELKAALQSVPLRR